MTIVPYLQFYDLGSQKSSWTYTSRPTRAYDIEDLFSNCSRNSLKSILMKLNYCIYILQMWYTLVIYTVLYTLMLNFILSILMLFVCLYVLLHGFSLNFSTDLQALP